MILKIIILIFCGFLIVMNVIYLRDNNILYRNALNNRNKFATGFYEFNFIIKIISLCLNGFFILFSYIDFQSINKYIINFFFIENTLNIIIYLVNIKEMNLNLLFLQIFIYLIIFILQRINICMYEENPIIIERTPSIQPVSPPLESPILSENETDPEIQDDIENEMWGSIYQEGKNFDNAYENNGYNNNCYSDTGYYNNTEKNNSCYNEEGL